MKKIHKQLLIGAFSFLAVATGIIVPTVVAYKLSGNDNNNSLNTENLQNQINSLSTIDNINNAINNPVDFVKILI